MERKRKVLMSANESIQTGWTVIIAQRRMGPQMKKVSLTRFRE